MRRRETHEWYFEVGTDLGRLSEELSRSGPKLARGKHWEPRIDLIEETERLIIKAEIAGVRADDIDLVYLPDRHSLIIRGIRHDDDGGNRTAPHQLEIYYGEFERVLALPDIPIDPSGVQAMYRNGFLYVALPKV